MTAKELKNALLQEAIQGKLVPQIASEGNARGLLEEIRKEKAKLVKEGKIKKEKPLPEITNEGIPFDIPDNWCWCRLGEVVYNNGQKTPDKVFSYIDIGSIDNEHQRLNEKENLIKPDEAPSRARKIVKAGDIIYSTVRPYLHNMCIIDKDFSKEPIASTGFAVMSSPKGLFNKYLFYYLLSPTFDNYANDTDNSKGVAYPAINDDSLYKGIVPLPPFAEQKRIVAAIEKFMPLIEEYGKKEAELKALNEQIGTLAKKAILQEAIQGKLVPQNPADGDARTLLEQIRKEQTKKGRHNGPYRKYPEISNDEKPFDIPHNWVWCRLGEIGDWKAGSTPSRSNPEFYNGKIPWLKTGDLNDGLITYIPESISEAALEKSSIRINPIGSVLIAMYGATIGKIGILNIEATTNQACCACIPSRVIYNKYLFYYLMSQKKEFTEKAEGGAQPNISREKLVVHLIGLPPLAEQYRIVSQIELLFAILDDSSFPQ